VNVSDKGGYIKQAWLVLALGGCFGAALAGVHAGLGGKIEANKLADTLGQIPSLVPGAVEGKAEVRIGRPVYRAVDSAGRCVGWVLPAAGQGFADRIQLLIGLDAQARTITGLYVLEQKETPGLGNRVEEPAWRGQFAGKLASRPLAVTKADKPGEGEIHAVTGATISSQSVTDIVNDAVAKFRGELSASSER
jgi:electron transport complex protein RnfG